MLDDGTTLLLFLRHVVPLSGLKCTLLSTFHLENQASIMNNIFANLSGILKTDLTTLIQSTKKSYPHYNLVSARHSV